MHSIKIQQNLWNSSWARPNLGNTFMALLKIKVCDRSIHKLKIKMAD
jgi:hypothetical protein